MLRRLGDRLRTSLAARTTLTVLAIFTVVAPCVLAACLQVYAACYQRAVLGQQEESVERTSLLLDQSLRATHDRLIRLAMVLPADRSADPRAMQAFLRHHRPLMEVFTNGLFVFSPAGRIVAETGSAVPRVGYDLGFREYIKRTVASGRPTISEPYISTYAHHNPVVMMTVPVFGRNGELAAILGGGFNLVGGGPLEPIARTAGTNGSNSYIVNAADEFVMHRDHHLLVHKNDAIPTLVHEAMEHGSASGVTPGTEPALTAARRLQAMPWVLVQSLPLDTALADLNRANRFSWALLLLGGLLATHITWVIMRRVTGPISTLSRALAEFDATGTLEELEVRSNDELGTMTRTYNSMTRSLGEATAALREKSELFQTLADFSSDGVFWENTQGEVVYCSPAMEVITGYTPEEFMATPRLFASMVAPESKGVWDEHLRHDQARAAGELSAVVVAIVTRQGEKRWISHSCRCIHDADGNWIGVRGSNSDVTRQRAADLATAAAVDAAVQAHSAKSLFLANMSHEIRIPAGGIAAAAQLLGATPLTGQQRALANDICRASERLTGLIDGILDFSELEAGFMRLSSGTVGLHELVEAACRPLSLAARRKGIGFSCSCAEGLPETVAVDGQRLFQVVSTLLGNAVKYTVAGGVTLSVTADDDMLIFSVRDSGCGMGEEQVAALFRGNPEAELDSGHLYGSSGLGLVLAGRLAQVMGGSIAVDSVLGHGSTFTLSLPLNAAGAPLQQHLPGPVEPAEIAGLRVLVAGGSQRYRRCLAALVRDCGCLTVSEAQTVTLCDLAVIAAPCLPSGEAAYTVYLAGADEEVPAGVDLRLARPVTVAALRGAIERACEAGRHGRVSLPD